ncbi:DUF4382 domain-containing protein [uncultured Algibacter sp.]|uniref:DUF4382 domain-containing protein n=1 Tax=uncultured Algibacter sp. TaxID=298659 RepID=UPI00263A0329|nr:DUF4382 domain-containing protein [uncultured Algibacter sp.]
MNMLSKLKLIVPLLFLSFLISCNDSESSSVNQGAPTISVRLVDSPGDYEAVNVDVLDVMIKMDDDSDDDNGWMSLKAEGDIVNLLEFTGGVSKVLVERFPIPAGTLSQMRLVLGDRNTIVIENEEGEDPSEYDLKTPSGQQSGLKVKIDALIEEGFTYDFVLDFDVDKSIVHAGNSGNIILKPVLYASAEASSGIIEGTVSPTDVPSIAKVLVSDPDGNFEITAYTNDLGAFALWGVPAGTYDVIVMPEDDNSIYSYGSATDVVVFNGEITTIADPIELMLKPGSITGKITNEGDAVVTASVEVGGETLSATTDENGVFLIENVPPGSYIVTLTPAEGSGLETYMMNNVEVKPTEVTDLGNIELQMTP